MSWCCCGHVIVGGVGGSLLLGVSGTYIHVGRCVIVGGSLRVCAANQLLSVAQDDFAAAYRLIKDVEPSTPQEYILKAVANAAIGQESGSVSA